MKTFKLKSLEIIDTELNYQKETRRIPLIDGLAINREEPDGFWLIEAYMHSSHLDFFQSLKQSKDQLIIQVKISKESNDPAIFIAKIASITEIGEHMNVLFDGKIVDQRKTKIVDLLSLLVKQGLKGEQLIQEFEKTLKQS